MNQRAEDEFGKDSYVFVLKPTYQTDGSAGVLKANIQDMADVLNGRLPEDDKNFPYIRYDQFSRSPTRDNAWVYVSQRDIPNQTSAIEAWMKVIAATFPKAIITEDSKAALLKIKWHAIDIPHKP